MSTPRNLAGNFMPHPESRRAVGTIGALNAEVVLDLDGDESVTIHLLTAAAFTATYDCQVSPDGVTYYPALAFAYTPGCINGTIPAAGQPIISEASTTAIQRTLCMAVGGMKKVRVRLPAWTSGNADVTITADTCASISPYVRDQRAATLAVTATGTAGAAVTATLPAVAGLRHYIDNIYVLRSATAALTPAAVPVVATTTNLPGAPALTFGADAAGVGIDKGAELDFGSAGLAATAINTATTVVCPAYTGVIWRVVVAYRLGL